MAAVVVAAGPMRCAVIEWPQPLAPGVKVAAPCCASHLEVKPEPANVPHDGAPRSARGTIRPLRSLNESAGAWPEATLSEMPATPLLASATARPMTHPHPPVATSREHIA